MFPSIRQGMIQALVVVLSLSLSAIEAANAYPDQPIKIIVTFPPGGSADIVIRALQPALSETLRQPVVIENRAGAGGNIGIGAVAQAAPDGYTLGVAAAGVLTVNPHLNRAAMPFDPVKDLAPVTLLAEIPFVLVSSQQSAIASVADLIAKAKAQPQGLSIGHGGNGTAMHLTSALFAQKAGVGIQLIAYRGTAPATTDVLAGHVPLAVLDIPASRQLIGDGKLKALGVSAAKRVVFLPDVPTLAEQGLSGFELRRLVWDRRARRHAARDHQHAECRLREGIERSRRDRKNPRSRRRTRAHLARGFCKIHPERKREMGEADRRGRDQERIDARPRPGIAGTNQKASGNAI